MKSFRQEAKFILMFFTFLTVFTIYSNLGMETEIVSKNPIQSSPVSTVEKKVRPTRNTASISEATAPILNKEFLCGPLLKKSPEKVDRSLVMISFKLCGKLNSVTNLALENQSNGFKAQIFKIEKNKFKTDYIQLNNGVNRLKLEAVLKDGQKIEESLEILSGS